MQTKCIFRVCMGSGKPENSWNFILTFSRTGKSSKKTTGPGKFWKVALTQAIKFSELTL